MKYLFTILNSFVVVLMAYFCVEMVYKNVLSQSHVMAGVHDSKTALRTSQKVIKQPMVNRAANQVIAKRNLFQVDIEKNDTQHQKSSDQISDQIEPTHLKLVLLGTVTGQDEKYAVIQDLKGKQQSLYLVGDTVQDAKIKQILRHKVILVFQGKDQILVMEEKSKSTASAMRKTPSFTPSIMPFSNKFDSNNLISSAADLMRQIKFRPHSTNGEPDGLMVYGIRPSSVFRKVGLRNGDIVQQVNGTPILSKADAAGLFDEILQADQAKVTLMRRGKVQELVYRMNGDSENENNSDE